MISDAIGAQSDMILTESLRELPVSAITENITAVIELQQQSPLSVSQRANDSKGHSSFDNPRFCINHLSPFSCIAAVASAAFAKPQ